MPGENSGLLESAKRLLSTLTSILSTRLELLANEWQEERLRLTQMLFFSLLALFCFGIFVLLLTVFILVLFWDDHRLAVLGGMSVVFFALGTLMTLSLYRLSQAKSKLFSISLAELAKDREHLGEGHDQPDQT